MKKYAEERTVLEPNEHEMFFLGGCMYLTMGWPLRRDCGQCGMDEVLCDRMVCEAERREDGRNFIFLEV